MTDLPVFMVDLSLLDWEDGTFLIRSFLPSRQLHASLDLYGILQPPWVWLKKGGRFAIVDGIKRLTWARARGSAAASCIVFPEDYDPDEIMLRRVEGKIFGPPLNVAEKAQVLVRLAEILPSELISQKYFPALNVALRPDSLDGWCLLAGAEEELLEAAAREQISERAALELMSWEEDARGEALGALKELRCSSSIQKEVLERATEVAVAWGTERMHVLRRPEVQAILERPDWNHRQKTQGLRDLLTQWRFPRLSARESRFSEDLSSMSLPKAIRVVHPPAFEGENWQLVLSFSNPRGLEDILLKAMDLARSSNLRNLMYPARPKQDTKP